MSKLLEQHIKIQNAIADLGQRMREQTGQTTVEWLVIAVGILALAGAFSGLWGGAAQAVVDEFKSIVQSVH